MQDVIIPIELATLSRAYIDHRTARHYSPRTLQQDEAALKHFISWCEERSLAHAHDITRPILERYRTHLHHTLDRYDKPLSARNQALKLMTLRGYFKWATRQNYLLYNPASELELPRRGKALPKVPLTPNSTSKCTT